MRRDDEPRSLPRTSAEEKGESDRPRLAAALASFESSDEAKRVERMAEQQIVETIHREGLIAESPTWRALATALAEYGYVVLVAWAVSGALPRLARRHGGLNRQRVPQHLQLDADDARSLATDVLVRSLERFRMRSLHSWDPAGGASLKTYFIGRCLLDLGDVYSSWQRREGVQDWSARVTTVAELPDVADTTVPGPAEAAADKLLIDELLESDPFLLRVITLQTEGFLLSEIAAALGTTTPSLRSKLHRFRHRLAEERDG